jgi:hypothetical protein
VFDLFCLRIFEFLCFFVFNLCFGFGFVFLVVFESYQDFGLIYGKRSNSKIFMCILFVYKKLYFYYARKKK